MENKVYTQNELKAQNIITMDYGQGGVSHGS